jgi:hypothetical protein
VNESETVSDSEAIVSRSVLDRVVWEQVLRLKPYDGRERRDPFVSAAPAFAEYDRLNYMPRGTGILANGLCLITVRSDAVEQLLDRPGWAPYFESPEGENTFVFATCGQVDSEVLEFKGFEIRVRSWGPSIVGWSRLDVYIPVPPQDGLRWILPPTCYKAHLPSTPPEIRAALEADA